MTLLKQRRSKIMETLWRVTEYVCNREKEGKRKRDREKGEIE